MAKVTISLEETIETLEHVRRFPILRGIPESAEQ
jgi:hypothetical protein